MSTTKTIKTLAVTAILAVLLVGCATKDVAVESADTPSVPVVTDTPAPVDTEAPVTADSPAGTPVPADQVEAIRAAGGRVFVPVSTRDAAFIVTGADIPAAVVADARTASGAAATPTHETVGAMMGLINEMEAAGLAAFFLYRAPADPGEAGDTVKYTVGPHNVPGAKDFYGSIDGGKLGWTEKSAAIAEVKPLMELNPTVVLVDLTL